MLYYTIDRDESGLTKQVLRAVFCPLIRLPAYPHEGQYISMGYFKKKTCIGGGHVLLCEYLSQIIRWILMKFDMHVVVLAEAVMTSDSL